MKHFIKILFSFLILFLTLPVNVALLSMQMDVSPLYPDVRIIHADGSEIIFEFIIQQLYIDTVKIDSRKYSDVKFFGGQSPDRINPYNYEQRFRPVTLALPSIHQPRIEVVETESREIRGLPLLPLGDIHFDEESLFRTIPFENQFTPVTTELVDIVDIGEVRGAILGTLRFHPVQLSAGGNITVHSRIVVRLSFGEGSFGRIDRATMESLRKVVINIDQLMVDAERNRETGILWETQSLSGSVLADGPWYRFTVEEDGIYRISATQLQEAGIPVSAIDPRTIRIFGNGGGLLPEDITKPRPEDLVEIAIYVHGEEDGQFEQNDYILFFGTSTHQWRYNPDTKEFYHEYHYYTDENVYFLTYGGEAGKRMAPLSSLRIANPVVPQYFISRLFYRDPKFNLIGSGKQWMGQPFTDQGSVLVFAHLLPGFTDLAPIQYRIQVAARAPSVTRFQIEDQGVELGTVSIPSTSLGSIIGNYAQRGPLSTFTRSGSLPDNRSSLRFQYIGGTSAEGYLEWFEIHYPRAFVAANDYLKITAPDTAGIVEYSVTGLSSTQIFAFDISDHSNVQKFSDATVTGGSIQFQVEQEKGEIRKFIVAGPNGYKTPSGLESIDNSNLLGIVDGVEFIIISHPDFLSEAQRLAEHRRTFPENKVLSLAVNVDDVYNEFSGGVFDPTAIRDFLYHANNNWTVKPRYVLLFGSGSFDYRQIYSTETPKNFIPTYQTTESLSQINSYTSDDYFVQFTPNSRRTSLAIGRLAAMNVDEARVMVDKIINYETNVVFGPWRNLITYVADDGLTTRGDDGNIHTRQSEELATLYTPSSFEQNKIYIIEYPTENTALGRRKPEANRAVIDAFNQGTLIMNFTGHGNPRVWTHEWIFIRETTIPQLFNRDKLAFVTAATCDFTRFDDPRELSGAELLMSRAEGGTIALLSSSRIVWSTDNHIFNTLFYSHLLSTNTEGKTARIGDALFATKQVRFGINDVKFILLGDPTLRLIVPDHQAKIASINEEPVTDTISLKALQKVRMEGHTLKSSGVPIDDFYGRMFVTVYDSEKIVSVDEWGGWSFTKPGNVIFRGESSISQGNFSSAFVIPKDISHEERNGRIALYFWNQQGDGRGYNDNIIFAGIDTTAVVDTEGPEIRIYLEDRNFRSGDLVSESPILIVDLFDEHGINISGGGVGHRIEAWLNNGEGIDLTDFYQGKIDSYQEGTIEYRLSDLEPGPHHLRLRAWDVYNNSSIGETFFSVASEDKLMVENVYNYPNPFANETVFTFQHNQHIPIDVEIKIYTVSGRLIATLSEFSITDRFVKIPWTGRDNDGDLVANGVYLYKVVARTVDGAMRNEALGRLAVIR